RPLHARTDLRRHRRFASGLAHLLEALRYRAVGTRAERALHSADDAAWLPNPGGRYGRLLPDDRLPPSGARFRRALERCGVRHSMANGERLDYERTRCDVPGFRFGGVREPAADGGRGLGAVSEQPESGNARRVPLPGLASLAACADRMDAAWSLMRELYRICRSITGDGVRKTLARVAAEVPLEIVEVPSGTPVFDWEVPREWNVREAWIADESGQRVVDMRDHTLHLMSYSAPVDAVVPLEELRPHLHSIPEHPDWIPYRTSYYREDWGFCLTHRSLESLRPGRYRVRIDSDFKSGSLTYGECIVPGTSSDEVLVFTHVCHPSLCNDNLTGIALAALLAKELRGSEPRYTYRFVFAPGTIGSITWLARNEEGVRRVRHGLVVGLVGDPG